MIPVFGVQNQVSLVDDKQVLDNLQIGKYRNHRVSIKNVKTSFLEKVQLIAEEITFVIRKGEKKKALKAFLEKNKKLFSKTVAGEERYFSSLPDLSQSEIEETKSILQNIKSREPEVVYSTIRNKYHDLTHQFFVMVKLETELPDGNLKEIIRSLRKNLEEKHGPEIYAGLNVTRDAYKFAKGSLKDVQEARDFYRKNILGYRSLAETYQNMLINYGTSRILEVSDFILNALGSDINSQRPSLSDIQLKPILDDIKTLQNLKTVRDELNNLVSFMHRRKYALKKLDVDYLMEKFLPLIYDNSLSVVSLETTFDEIGIPHNIEAQIGFTNFLENVFHDFPEKVFIDEGGREALIDFIRNYSRSLTEEEGLVSLN